MCGWWCIWGEGNSCLKLAKLSKGKGAGWGQQLLSEASKAVWGGGGGQDGVSSSCLKLVKLSEGGAGGGQQLLSEAGKAV